MLRGADRKANTIKQGVYNALQRGDSRALDSLAQLDDAHGGVGASATRIDATELVVGQAASKRIEVC